MKRNLQGYQFVANSDENVGSEEKQTREVRQLEKQIQNYLQRLDDLIHKVDCIPWKKIRRMFSFVFWQFTLFHVVQRVMK